MKTKKRLAVIGASYLQMPLIEKAKEKGLEVHVFAWKANDPGETAADVFYPVSIVEKEQIAQICRELEIDGICSIASDLAMVTVNYVAQNLGLPSNTLECTRLSTNKHAMRQAFAKAGIPSCQSVLADTASLDRQWSYPLIVKPADRSGSRGISKVESQKELEPALKAAAMESFEDQVLIEEFIEGKEYSAEYISQNGIHTFLAVTQKFTTGAPHFIETGHREPSDLSEELVKKVQELIPRALDALEITTGASHSEFKVDGAGNIRMIEIGGRMGGDCIGSHLVPISTGVDFTGMVIDAALGNPLDWTPVGIPRPVKSQFIMEWKDYEDLQQLQKEKPEAIAAITDLNLENLGHTTDSSNRSGCYIQYLDI